MVNFTETIISNDHEGRRFDRFLRHFFADLSQSDIEKLLRSKMIRLDGQKAKADTRLYTGSVVRYPDFLTLAIVENHTKLTPIIFPEALILYQDSDLMVINKPHGLPVQGGSKTHTHLDMMLETLPKRNGYRPSTVHRLDKDTSGCLLIAKKPSIAAKLGEALKNREFEKYYVALTQNIPYRTGGMIENYLAKSTTGQRDLMQVVDKNFSYSQYAQSLYFVLSHSDSTQTALILLAPITGRTHQLRVHCSVLDSPIIGDPKYNPQFNEYQDIAPKLCLHAAKLIFMHPVTHKKIEIDAPLPEHFIKTAQRCELGLQNLLSYDNREILKHFSSKNVEQKF